MKKIFYGLMAVATAVITHVIVYFILMYCPFGISDAFLIISIYPIGMMIAFYLADKCYMHGHGHND